MKTPTVFPENDLYVPLISEQNFSDANALEKLYNYYIKESQGDPIPFGRAEKIQLALEIIGGSSGIYFFPPSWEYAKNKAPWLKYTLVLSNPVTNAAFLMKATDDFFESAAQEWKAPAELSDVLELPTRKEWWIKQIKILLGTTACVVPFSIATYLFPLPGCDSEACLTVIVTHSTIANLILHAISWNLIFTPAFWYYRLPSLPFEKIWERCQHARLTPQEKRLLNIKKQQNAIYQKYKDILAQFFTYAAEKIVNKDKNTRSNEIKLAADPETGSLEKLSALVYEEKNSVTAQPPSRIWGLSTVHRLLMKGGLDIIGAGFMAIGCLGWTGNPIYLASTQGLNPGESVAAGGLPAYSMLILSAFYGAFTLRQIYEFLTDWRRPKEKFPFEARLYPKTFTLFLLVNVYLSVFTYATAEELVRTVFSDEMWDDYRPVIEGITYPAMQSLTFVSLLSLFNTLLRKSFAKFKSEGDEKMASRFLVKTSVMSQRLQQIKGEYLMASLQEYTPDQLKYLGIQHAELQGDLSQLEKLKQPMILNEPSEEEEKTMNPATISQSRNCCSFLRQICPSPTPAPSLPLVPISDRFSILDN